METNLLNIFSDIYFKTPLWYDYVLLGLSILFLAFSAFFSSAKVAYFSLSKEEFNEIEDSDLKKDKTTLKLLASTQKLLATIIIGAYVSQIGFIILAATFIYSVWDFEWMPVFGFVVSLLIIAFLFIIFALLIPKVYASEFSLKYTRRSSKILLGLQNFFKPFVDLLAQSKALMYNSLTKINMNTISVDELSQALDMGTDTQEEDKEMLEGIIKFGNIQVSDVMTSRVDMVDVDTKLDYRQLMDVVVDSGYSRLPVYSGSRDNIKGILFSKDLLLFLDKPSTFRWQTLIRQAYYVPETKKIDDLLIEFQENRVHLALVVDEYGGVSGLITLEDIIEEIVGDISDEYDEEKILYQKLDNHTYIFEAKILLNDFFKITNIESKDFEKFTEDVETLAGMILEIKGEMPQKNEMLQYEHYIFEILQADNRRIKKVKLHIKNDPDNAHEDSD
ncbi:MAG: gliding motility-associated protein GldE [Paludibacteraceae bacterium]